MPDPDYRALCAELLTAIQLYTKLNPASSEMSAFELTEKLMDAMAATNAALAQLEPEGDEGIDDLVAWLWSMRDLAGECNPDEQRRYGLAATLLGQKAAETTHWRPATLAQSEPQEEAGEVADWLHDHALSCRELGRNDWAAQSTRAATLLQQLSAIENLKTTNWKARCAELADRLDDALTYTVQSDTERSMRQLITRTRTALAQPEPEGPPMSVPGDAEGLAEVFWGRYDQPEPEVDEGIDDLVAWLWSMRDLAGECNPDEQRRYGLAATLLGQKAAETTHWRPATLAQPEPEAGQPAIAEEAYLAFVQICKGNSDDAGTYDADEKLVRRALKKLSDLERNALPVPGAEVG
jgi:hypothetical protein